MAIDEPEHWSGEILSYKHFYGVELDMSNALKTWPDMQVRDPEPEHAGFWRWDILNFILASTVNRGNHIRKVQEEGKQKHFEFKR